MRPPLVLLHGFTQTGAAWEGVVAALGGRPVLAPDLRGHGAAASVRPIDTASLVADVLALCDGPFELCGYSMGGRLALHVALAAPGRVTRLTLVSASAGLEDEAARAARRDSDEALAAALERDGIEAFAARWAAQPLFADQPEAVRAAAQAQRLAQDPAGLAASLRGFGAGTMPSAWHRLAELRMPVLVVAGRRDAKYAALGERLAAALPDGRLELLPAGHAVPLEAPARLARLLS